MKIGDLIEITGSYYSGHHFSLGEIVRVTGVHYTGVDAEHLDRRGFWAVNNKDFKLIKTKQMEKKDLKTGMICKTRNHLNYITFSSDIVRAGGCMSLDSYHNDLMFTGGDRDYDIIEVFDSNMVSLWKREEKVEVTLQEVADKMGIPVDQLRIKD